MSISNEELRDEVFKAIEAGNYEPVSMILEILCLAVCTGDKGLVEEYAAHLDLAFGCLHQIPDELCSALLTLVGKPEFAHLENASAVLLLFDLNWPVFSAAQQSAVLATLAATYENFSYYESCMGITEFLGFTLRDAKAFQILSRLRSVEAEIPRQCLPHGFEHLARDCPDKEIARQALAELLFLRTDPAPAVREEVEAALERLTKRGVFPPS